MLNRLAIETILGATLLLIASGSVMRCSHWKSQTDVLEMASRQNKIAILDSTYHQVKAIEKDMLGEIRSKDALLDSAIRRVDIKEKEIHRIKVLNLSSRIRDTIYQQEVFYELVETGAEITFPFEKKIDDCLHIKGVFDQGKISLDITRKTRIRDITYAQRRRMFNAENFWPRIGKIEVKQTLLSECDTIRKNELLTIVK